MCNYQRTHSWHIHYCRPGTHHRCWGMSLRHSQDRPGKRQSRPHSWSGTLCTQGLSPCWWGWIHPGTTGTPDCHTTGTALSTGYTCHSHLPCSQRDSQYSGTCWMCRYCSENQHNWCTGLSVATAHGQANTRDRAGGYQHHTGNIHSRSGVTPPPRWLWTPRQGSHTVQEYRTDSPTGRVDTRHLWWAHPVLGGWPHWGQCMHPGWWWTLRSRSHSWTMSISGSWRGMTSTACWLHWIHTAWSTLSKQSQTGTVHSSQCCIRHTPYLISSSLIGTHTLCHRRRCCSHCTTNPAHRNFENSNCRAIDISHMRKY